jgi:hypothetical protein
MVPGDFFFALRGSREAEPHGHCADKFNRQSTPNIFFSFYVEKMLIKRFWVRSKKKILFVINIILTKRTCQNTLVKLGWVINKNVPQFWLYPIENIATG